MNEYRIKVTIRNNLILSAIEALGFKSQAEFCRATGMHPQSLNRIISMRVCPINQTGEFCEEAKELMEILGAAPLDLWTDEQLTLRLNRNTGETTVGKDAVSYFLEHSVASMTLPNPEDVYAEKQARKLISGVVNTLTPREEGVLAQIYINDATLREAGEVFDVSVERTRQIEAKALRKLRHPNLSEFLRQIGEETGMLG